MIHLRLEYRLASLWTLTEVPVLTALSANTCSYLKLVLSFAYTYRLSVCEASVLILPNPSLVPYRRILRHPLMPSS